MSKPELTSATVSDCRRSVAEPPMSFKELFSCKIERTWRIRKCEAVCLVVIALLACVVVVLSLTMFDYSDMGL